MPRRPCPRCRRLYEGKECEHCERKRQRGRLSASRRLYDRKWRAYRRGYLMRPENRLCALCGEAEATLIDHIIAPKGDRRVFWDPANHQPACGPCNRKKAIESEGAL